MDKDNKAASETLSEMRLEKMIAAANSAMKDKLGAVRSKTFGRRKRKLHKNKL